MFKKQPTQIDDLIGLILRRQGLETPLLQQRVLNAWEKVAGSLATRYTQEKFISNQTLHVKIVNPALKQDLLMRRSQLVRLLNQEAGGSFIISDIRFY